MSGGGKARALLGTALFFLAAPGTVAGLVPWLISRWAPGPPLLSRFDRVAGPLVVACGLAALASCFARFALEGRGTPAPVAPTERLVISGLYRHVRNPMYLAVLAVVLGQALWLGSSTLVAYAALLASVFHAFVRLYEEPTLRSRHGDEYAGYTAGVGRWWPRFRPWREPGAAARRARKSV